MSRMTTRDLKIFMQLHQGDPFAPPSWFWAFAHQLQDTQFRISTIHKHCGAWTARAVEHLRRDQTRYRAINTAQAIFDAAECQRDELEARILAGQTDEEIAQRMRLEADVVGAYAGLFFVVRDRLQASAWIRTQAIDWQGVGTPFPLGQFLKYMAYHAGICILESLIPILQRIAAAILDGTLDTLRSHDRSVASVCRAIQINSLEVTQDNVFDLFHLHLQLMRAERQARHDQTEEGLAETSRSYEDIFANVPTLDSSDARKWAMAA